MKYNLNLVFVGTLLLAAVACQREKVANTTDSNEVKEVTTQFVLNVAAAPSTKMTADAVQQNQNFRGIQDVKLFTYKTDITLANTPYVLKTNGAEVKEFDFGDFFASGGINNEGNNNQNGGNGVASKRVLQLSIPVGVDAVLFYGKASRAGGATDSDFGGTNLNATAISGTPQNTVIAAKKILSTESLVNQYDATGRLMIGIINDIMARGVGPLTDQDNALVQRFGPLPAVTWAQYGHRYEIDKMADQSRYSDDLAIDHQLQGLEEILGRCYFMFTYILPPDTNPYDQETEAEEYAQWKPVRPKGEYRAGSSNAVKKMVMDMYKVISAANNADPTTANEANAKRVAGVILDRAALYFDMTTGNYKSVAEIKDLLVGEGSYNKYDEETWTSLYGGAQNLNGYPFEDFGVPEGAAQLGFYYQGQIVNNTQKGLDEFFYRHPNFPLVNPNMTEFEPRKYLYPAELWYYVNSPIRTTSTDVTVASYPDGIGPWNTEGNWSGWNSPGKVEGNTRGVAVVNNINYGVAMLKTKVIFNTPNGILVDNRYELTNEPNREIEIENAQLELRGVLVGGVNPRMDWQFLRKYTSYTSGDSHEGLGNLSLFDGVIYDHSIANKTIPTPESSPNYTLVYDNYNSSELENNQNDVYVALEIVNNGDAFYGRDNMIPHGGVFYLVAKLDKPNGDQINTLHGLFPSDHQIPPVYGVDDENVSEDLVGKSKKFARVFIQDFVTSATFRLGETSLQKAYYSVPDLRASQMSLGLSVDLQWIPGLEYVLDID